MDNRMTAGVGDELGRWDNEATWPKVEHSRGLHLEAFMEWVLPRNVTSTRIFLVCLFVYVT